MFRSQQIIIREYVCTSLELSNYLKNIEFRNPEDHSRCCGSKTCSRYMWWSVWSRVGVFFCIFMYFNIEIGILD